MTQSLQDILKSQTPILAYNDATRLRWLEWAHGRTDGADIYPHISVGPTSTVIWSQQSGLTCYAIGYHFYDALDRAILRSIQEGKFGVPSFAHDNPCCEISLGPTPQ